MVAAEIAVFDLDEPGLLQPREHLAHARGVCADVFGQLLAGDVAAPVIQIDDGVHRHQIFRSQITSPNL